MKLSRLEIEHFKCISYADVLFRDFTIFIGPNNVGKSTILQAVDLSLSVVTRGITEDWFHNRDTSKPIVLTVTFDNLSDYQKREFAAWLVEDKFIVRKTISWIENKPKVDWIAQTRAPAADWLDENYEDYRNRKKLETLPIAPFIPESGNITRSIYRTAIEGFLKEHAADVEFITVEKPNPQGYSGVLKGLLPDLYLVPAVRDLSDETKTSSSALLGKLVVSITQRIQSGSEVFREYNEAIRGIKSLFDGTATGQKIVEVSSIEERLERLLDLWNVKVNIVIEPPDLGSLLQLGTSIEVDDGIETRVDFKGHGLQRSMIFALMRVWSEIRTQSEDTDESRSTNRKDCIFAFEEPELYLHPHVCRASYESLRSVSSDNQVMFCTHSAQFVNMDDYRAVNIVSRTGDRDTLSISRVVDDLFEKDEEAKDRFRMVAFFNPDRSEVFFADKVILAEGQTEKSVFPVLANRLGIGRVGLTILDCGGKFNLPLYERVLNEFRIPYIVVFDEDPIPEGLVPRSGEKASEKYKNAKLTFEFNSKIMSACNAEVGDVVIVPGKIEDLLGVSKSSGEKIGKPLAAVRHYLDSSNPISPELEQMIRRAYA